MSGTTLRGSVLRHNVLAIKSLHGDAVWERIRGALPPDVRERIDKVTPLDQIEPEVFGALHDALKATVGAKGWEASHAIGSEAARLEFGGVYRVVLRAIQYDTIWDRMERTWNHIVGKGAFRWIERKEGYVKCDIVGVRGFHPGTWASAAGRAERLLLMSGAKSASVVMLDSQPTRGTFEAYWVP